MAKSGLPKKFFIFSVCLLVFVFVVELVQHYSSLERPLVLGGASAIAAPVVVTVLGDTPVEDVVPGSPFAELQNVIRNSPGNYAVYIKTFDDSRVYEYNAAQNFYGASLYKIIVAAATFHTLDTRDLNRNFRYQYTSADYEEGSGVLAQEVIGSRFSIEYLLEVLLKQSDNVAQNILVRLLREETLDFVFEKIMGVSSPFVAQNQTNPAEVGRLLEELYFGRVLSEQSTRQLFDLMKYTSFDDRVHLGLGNGLVFSHKIGSWPDSWHDCGIVFSPGGKALASVCLMSSGVSFESFSVVAKGVGEFVTGAVASQ